MMTVNSKKSRHHKHFGLANDAQQLNKEKLLRQLLLLPQIPIAAMSKKSD
jgi:hypothetical protein